ncbi:MAG: cation diffusion facilitator family transporter [Thermoplasmata archaeon]|nr:cation transporter [Thermoplasmatales archaeon]
MRQMRREQYAYLEGMVSVAGNIVIFILKLYIGIMINSLSLISDAYHTLTDIIGSIIIIIGFYFASRPPDELHPLGHGRIEHLTTLMGAIVLFLTGGFIVFEGFLRLLKPEEIIFNIFFIAVILLTVIIKEGMARLAFHYGRKIEGDALNVDAWHHRSDALLSIGVIAVIFLNGYFIYLDGIFSIFVGILIIYEAMIFSRKGISKLLGESLPDEKMRILRDIFSRNGVKGHDIMVHDYGNRKIITLHIDLDSSISAGEAHMIASNVENDIRDRLGMDATVHVDTYDVNLSNSIELDFREIIKSFPEIKGYRDFEIYSSSRGPHADVFLYFDPGITLEKMEDISNSLEKLFIKKYGIRLFTHFESIHQNINLSEKNTEHVGDQR